MNFLRNKEVRIHIGLLLILTVVTTTIGAVNSLYCGFIVFITAVIFSFASIMMTKYRYDKIASLTEVIDMILHSDEEVLLGDTAEGELAVLESEIKKMTMSLRESAFLLQKEKVNLTDSIADIAHQLRTPLTTINMVMSFLRKADLTLEERFKYINDINHHLNRVDWLISSLLKISKIEAGTAVFKREKVDVSMVIAKAIEPLMVPLEIRDQLFDFQGFGRETYYGDFNWSVEAFSNIIKNCSEHTQAGGHIQVRAKENVLYTEIIIEDDGSGIDPKDLPHLFERFYRGKASSESSVGIGLALTRMIVQNQNGSIKVENRKTKGSRFIIRFYKGVGHRD
ncbi:MAG: HAMP domain-containing sensor histidine kinase [Anaerovoracaceae bacterium]